MANIKSAKKRVIVNRTKAERNKAIRVYHKNNAARKVSRVSKAVNSIA